MPTWKGIVGKGFSPDEFRQYVAGLSFSGWRPQFVVVHNTSAPRLSQWHSTPGGQRMLNLESYYRDTMKWSAGPHLFVADDLIWVFTPLTTPGVHSPSWNGVAWGVEIVGEFQDEAFSGAIRANAIDALAILHQWRGLDPQTLRFHREDPLTTHKTCPGSNIVKPDLIAAVQARIANVSQGEHPPGLVASIARGRGPVATGPAYARQRGFLGWKPDVPDYRDYQYGTMRLGLERPAMLPKSVDLRPGCPPIYDQGQLNSCTANAIAAAFEFLEIKSGRGELDPARLFIYFNERKLENDTDSDKGAYLRDGIKCIASTGICSESDWPYDILNFAEQPPDSCYQAAQTYKALSYFRINNTNIDELKGCLAAGFPFVFGFAIYESFYDADSNGGIVAMPGDEPLKGGHAVLAVGYDDATQRFTIQNSWGAAVGDRGYYFMPYQYLSTTQLSDDFWTIRSISGPSAPGVATGSDGAPADVATVSEPPTPAAEAPVGLARDMEEAKKYFSFIKSAAEKYSLTPSLICAIGSRESGWGLGSDMKPKGPAGTGDWTPRNPSRFGYAMPPDGLGWGRGLLQVDYQLDFGKTGNWQDPQANILYGCGELAGNIAYFAKSAKGIDPMLAGIAAYNCGRGGVNKALKNKYDVDHYTAGGDYSKDVMGRMQWFKQEGFDQLTAASPPLGLIQGAGETFTVHKGKRYQATITLNWFEQQVATNATIAGQLSQLGFTQVIVTGDGGTRQAVGLWNGPDTTSQIDPHLSHIVELS